MAKKKGAPKMPAVAEPTIRHARIELPDDVYQRLKGAAARSLLPMTAYIRLAIMEKMETDERRAGGKG